MRVMVKRLWCFPFFLCWLVVGALLGVWDGTCVVVPVYRLLHAVGGLLVGGLFCGVWVLCENWIVDASILFFCKFDFSNSFSVVVVLSCLCVVL